jgi:hypothetical protein
MVRQWLRNYQTLKAKLERICELNHHLLRPDKRPGAAGSRRPTNIGRQFGNLTNVHLLCPEVGRTPRSARVPLDPLFAQPNQPMRSPESRRVTDLGRPRTRGAAHN